MAVAQTIDTRGKLMQGFVVRMQLPRQIPLKRQHSIGSHSQHCGRKVRALRISSICMTSFLIMIMIMYAYHNFS